MPGYKAVKIWVKPKDWDTFRKKCVLSDTNMRKEIEKFLIQFSKS